MTKQELQTLLSFGAGFALAAVLSVSLDAPRFVPTSVAFGLLCFGCGVCLTQFLVLRRRDEEFRKTNTESLNRWAKEFEELERKKSQWLQEKEACEAEKAEREARENESNGENSN